MNINTSFSDSLFNTLGIIYDKNILVDAPRLPAFGEQRDRGLRRIELCL